MKFICLILFACCSLTTFSQSGYNKVDRVAIKKTVTDSGSAGYYPVLLKRYNAFDKTLLLEDYRLLYYGFVFQPAYNALGEISGKEIREAMDKKNYKKASQLCDELLKRNPVSLKGNYIKGVALHNLDKKDSMASRYMVRYKNLMAAIISSGDGLTCPTAFKTIAVSDEYEVIYVNFQVEKFRSQALQYPCDELTISPSALFKHKKIYFDTSETFLGMQKLFDDEK